MVSILAIVAGIGAMSSVSAHDFRAGTVSIDHPYATPTPPGARNGAVYFRAIENRGTQPDALVGATSPVAGSVEIHRTTRTDDVARMREVDRIDLPGGARLTVRPGGDWHLMLVDLKRPLAEGDRFTVRLRFERGGEREVAVWVQRPREAGGHRH
jgi:periplasmic copper chaperone A